jgi:hypothetical protein
VQRPIAVLTTIQSPTSSVLKLTGKLEGAGIKLIVIGDEAGPSAYPIAGAGFFPLADQSALPFRTARTLPTRHYSRKNLGYLLAMAEGAECIFETDDDNAPDNAWAPCTLRTTARITTSRKWANVYRMFSDENIWPRGFPLQFIADERTFQGEGDLEIVAIDAPIQQELVNSSPDVDAIWRLVFQREFTFSRDQPSVWLPPGTWCPFNSQATWWWPAAYPLLYLPSYCSFRLTDIFRSLIAQRCLWELGFGVVFHPPQMIQDRNYHDLMKDFTDEISGYLRNAEIADALDALALRRGTAHVSENMRMCYEELACPF